MTGSTDARPTLSVVTPFRNAASALSLTLAGLAAQTLPRAEWEVVVVDDASDRAAPALGDLPADLNLRVVRLPERRGPGGARNAGAAVARGDVLVLHDADGVPAPDLLAVHRAAHARGDAVVYGRRYESGWETIRRVAAGDRRPADPDAEADLRDDRLRGEPADSRAPWLWAYSHDLSLPRALFAEVGGFDEGFRGWGHEDVELGYRLFTRLGRRADRFAYRRDAQSFHVPHFVDAANNRASGRENLLHFKRSHPRYDVELYGDQWPMTVATKIAEYERRIADLLDRGAGRVPESLVHRIRGTLPAEPRVFAVAAESEPVEKLDARVVVRHDHGRPATESDGHLLGVWTTLPDDAVDVVLHVDLWRVLTTHDLNRMISESLRLAPRLLLVDTEHPADGPVDHLAEALAPVLPTTRSRSDAGTVLEVRRPAAASQ